MAQERVGRTELGAEEAAEEAGEYALGLGWRQDRVGRTELGAKKQLKIWGIRAGL